VPSALPYARPQEAVPTVPVSDYKSLLQRYSEMEVLHQQYQLRLQAQDRNIAANAAAVASAGALQQRVLHLGEELHATRKSCQEQADELKMFGVVGECCAHLSSRCLCDVI
jgi:hypothetical protein